MVKKTNLFTLIAILVLGLFNGFSVVQAFSTPEEIFVEQAKIEELFTCPKNLIDEEGFIPRLKGDSDKEDYQEIKNIAILSRQRGLDIYYEKNWAEIVGIEYSPFCNRDKGFTAGDLAINFVNEIFFKKLERNNPFFSLPLLKWKIMATSLSLGEGQVVSLQQYIGGTPIWGATADVFFRESEKKFIIEEVSAQPITETQFVELQRWLLINQYSSEIAEENVVATAEKYIKDHFSIKTISLSTKIVGSFYFSNNFWTGEAVVIDVEAVTKPNLGQDSDFLWRMWIDKKTGEVKQASTLLPFFSKAEGVGKGFTEEESLITHFCENSPKLRCYLKYSTKPYSVKTLDSRGEPINDVQNVEIVIIDGDTKLPILSDLEGKEESYGIKETDRILKKKKSAAIDAYKSVVELVEFFLQKYNLCVLGKRRNESGNLKCSTITVRVEGPGKKVLRTEANWNTSTLSFAWSQEYGKSHASNRAIVGHEFAHLLIRSINILGTKGKLLVRDPCSSTLEGNQLVSLDEKAEATLRQWRALEESLSDSLGFMLAVVHLDKEGFTHMKNHGGLYKFGWEAFDEENKIRNMGVKATLEKWKDADCKHWNADLIYENASIPNYASYLLMERAGIPKDLADPQWDLGESSREQWFEKLLNTFMLTILERPACRRTCTTIEQFAFYMHYTAKKSTFYLDPKFTNTIKWAWAEIGVPWENFVALD